MLGIDGLDPARSSSGTGIPCLKLNHLREIGDFKLSRVRQSRRKSPVVLKKSKREGGGILRDDRHGSRAATACSTLILARSENHDAAVVHG